MRSGTGLHPRHRPSSPSRHPAGHGALVLSKRPSRRTAPRVAVPARAPAARPGAGPQGPPRGTRGSRRSPRRLPCQAPTPALSPGASPTPSGRQPGLPPPFCGARSGTRGRRARRTNPRPGTSQQTAGPGPPPPPRQGGGAATGLTGPERRRDRPGSRSSPPARPGTPVNRARGGGTGPGPATHRPNRSPRCSAPFKCPSAPTVHFRVRGGLRAAAGPRRPQRQSARSPLFLLDRVAPARGPSHPPRGWGRTPGRPRVARGGPPACGSLSAALGAARAWGRTSGRAL